MDEVHEQSRRRLTAATSIAALAAAGLLLVAVSLHRIWAVDFWWQWATGRLIATGGIPAVDPYSFVSEGRPWIELRWLYCWGLYRLTELFGFPAAVLVKCALMIAAFGLVAAAPLRREGRIAAAVAITIGVLASSQSFLVRPELATYFFFALDVWILDAYRRRGSRWLYAIPLIQVLWTNSHTVFILGPCLVGLSFVVHAGERIRRRGEAPEALAGSNRRLRTVAAVLVATFLACLINPYGLASLGFTAQIFREVHGTAFKEAILELRGPFEFDADYHALFYYKLLVALCLASIAAAWRRLDPFWLLLAASQLYLSILAIRNIPLFALAAVPLVIHNFQVIRPPVGARSTAVGSILTLVVAGAVVATCGWQGWRLVTDRFHVDQGDTNQFGLGIATSRYPEGAVRFLERHGLRGRLFNTMTEGAYLLAHGFRVFIDPRQEVHGEERFVEYLDALRDRDRFQSTLERYDIELLLLDVRSRGVRFALESKRWRPVYVDEVAVVFVPLGTTEPPLVITPSVLATTVEDVRTRLPRSTDTPPASWWSRVRSPSPYEGFAQALIQLGQPREAIPFLEDAVALAPDPRAALTALVVAEQRVGDGAAERAALERLIALGSADPAALQRLAAMRVASGDARGARALLERAVAADPASVAAWDLLGKVAAQLGDFDAARRALGRAVELAPRNAGLRANLGRALINSGHPREGLASLELALGLAPNDVDLLRDLAMMRADAGDSRAAREYLRRGLAIEPDNPQLRAIAERLGEP